MATVGRTAGLQTIFSFFLGLMVAAFVGVGVYTFHPPDTALDDQIQELDRQEQAMRGSRPLNEMTAEERDRIEELTDERRALRDASREEREAWGRGTSIILIALATLAMAVSLVRADQLPVISNGLLLGGVFTMIYGVGWIVATDTSVARFVVMAVALAVTLALGYARFVRQRTIPASAVGPEADYGVGFDDIDRRLRALEERMNEAARALGTGDRGSRPG